ncbi:MAG: OmpA family protein [Planctomycetes bacterium]|nr:OmpA family protein [Planctomycetota bacterium]
MRRPQLALATVIGLAAGWLTGCANNPFKTAPPTGPLSLEPPPGVAAPAHTLPQTVGTAAPPSYATIDGSQLEAALTRSRQESQLMQDEIAALRDQLSSTSNQLAHARTAGMPAASPTGGGAPGASASTPAATMKSALVQLKLPDLEPRFDGAVVRIDVPADRLFDDGTANLTPGGVASLTQVAVEFERIYPGHFIGIEGHLDSEPLQNATWTSAHQLTAARAAAVFDFLTTRTALKQGQLFIVAHGANHPLVSNATAAGRARNRRVELVVYPERIGNDG